MMLAALAFVSCRSPAKNRTHRAVSDSSIAAGKTLAGIHCQRCHMLPDPSLLDARTWQNSVLPAMGPRLGIFNYGLETYPFTSPATGAPANYYPSKPVLTHREWQAIILPPPRIP
jgi:hypothetical protein